MTEATLAAAEGILFPLSAAGVPPERGLIAIVMLSSGVRRETILVREVVAPEPGDVRWDNRRGLLFSPQYKSRATDAANAVGAGLIFVHTHPTLAAPLPSPADLEADRRDLYYLGQGLASGAPLVAAVVNERRRWSARRYAFRYPTSAAEVALTAFGPAAGVMRFAEALRVVGPSVRLCDLSNGEHHQLDAQAQDSTIRLWGTVGQGRLGRLRIAIVGLGGVGGILAEHIARLGIGEVILIDFDRVKMVNKNRSQGATLDELKRRALKVDVGARLALEGATCPSFRVTRLRGSIVELGTVEHLLDCDLILNAADSPWARQVLDHVAFAHLVPAINGGTELCGDPDTLSLIAAKCEIAVTAPGHPCFECADVYTRRSATEAREHPSVRGARAYVRAGGEVPDALRAPSMISSNALVAGLMQLRLQAITLGTTPNAIVGTQRYHLIDGTMDYALRRTCKPDCPRAATIALGDHHPLPLGSDRDYEVARGEEKDDVVERDAPAHANGH